MEGDVTTACSQHFPPYLPGRALNPADFVSKSTPCSLALALIAPQPDVAQVVIGVFVSKCEKNRRKTPLCSRLNLETDVWISTNKTSETSISNTHPIATCNPMFRILSILSPSPRSTPTIIAKNRHATSFHQILVSTKIGHLRQPVLARR